MRTLVRLFVYCAMPLSLYTAAFAKADDFKPEDHLNPAHAYVRLTLSDAAGRPTPPNIPFALTRNLDTRSQVQLTRDGFLVGNQLVCTWKSASEMGSPYAGQVLVANGPGKLPCPDDVPVKSFAAYPGAVFLEIERLDGFVAEIAFRGRRYYFSVRPFVGRRWEQPWMLIGARSSPPLTGGVDIPRLFHPRDARTRLPVLLRQTPSLTAPVVTELGSSVTLKQFHIGRGAMLATVFQRSDGWSRVGLIDGRTAWLAPPDSGKFVSFERLAMRADGMSGDWGWALSATAGAERHAVAHDPRRRWIGYLVPVNNAPAPIPVFATPDRTRRPIGEEGTEGAPFHFAYVQPDHNRPANAIVFSRQPGWLEIGLEGTGESYREEGLRHAWIEDLPGRYVIHSIDAVEGERLLSSIWGPEANPSATVHEMKRINGVLWLRVTVFAGEPCERELYHMTPIVLGEGWLPAHDRFGQSVVWFETYCD